MANRENLLLAGGLRYVPELHGVWLGMEADLLFKDRWISRTRSASTLDASAVSAAHLGFSLAAALVDQLYTNGHVTLHLGPGECRALSATKQEASAFFRLAQDQKASESYSDLHFGYRSSGIEYSASPDRPDLNECLSYSNYSEGAARPSSLAGRFYAASAALCEILDAMAQELLLAIRNRYRTQQMLPNTWNGSWLQANFYRPSAELRNELQDKHEDGHLFTIWNSEEPGMEIFPGESKVGIPVVLPPDQMLILPGSLLTLLTGGDVNPLYHQVSRAGTLPERISVMYFVNPSCDRPLHAYNQRSGEELIDIAMLGARNPAMFGLPKIGPKR
jgi:isopenicillin N synthase-like dioxygenase